MRYTLSLSGPVDAPSDRTALDWYKECLEMVSVGHRERPEAIMSGCAYGIDTYVPYAAIKLWPQIKIILVIPAAPHNEKFVGEMMDRPSTQVIRMTAYEGMTNSERYMERNDELARRADELAAFPRNPIEAMRSGTWATVRRFRKRDKYIWLFPMSERPQ